MVLHKFMFYELLLLLVIDNRAFCRWLLRRLAFRICHPLDHLQLACYLTVWSVGDKDLCLPIYAKVNATNSTHRFHCCSHRPVDK